MPEAFAAGTAAAAPLLDVVEVSKSFRGLKAVSRASLAVSQGEIVALIGPNGAGKTTLFNLVAGALAPDEGRIRFRGTDIAGRRPDLVCEAGIGRTFQIVKPFADMTVLENAMVGGFRGTSDRARCAGSTCGRCATGPPRRSRCRIASGSKSRARSPPNRPCCCSTR